MKISFKITTKIWLTLSFLFIGYFFSMLIGFMLGHQTEVRLRAVSEYLFPAAQQSQKAFLAFNEQIKLYNNAIIIGDKSFIEKASAKSEEAQKALRQIVMLRGVDFQKKDEVANTLQILKTFTQSAQEVYLELCTAFNDDEEMPEVSDGVRSIEEKSSHLARVTKSLQKMLQDFAETFNTNFRTELSFISEVTHQQRYVSIYIFAAVTSCTLILMTFLIRRSITGPLMRIVKIAGEVTVNKENIEWLPETRDEIGTLSRSLRLMTKNLKSAEKKYRGIFENAVEGIFQTSPDGYIINANPSTAKIMGYESLEEMMQFGVKITARTYVNPAHRKKIIRILEKEGQVAGFETQFYQKDKTPVWISLSARTVKDVHGHVIYFEGSMVDITEHKKREKAELEREIANAANEKIMSSIEYAEKIQQSLLPNLEHIKKLLPESFFIWEPRDIVGGDIFFTDFFGKGFIIAVIDCTGHGVPGAFMTMIASSAMRRIIRDEGEHDPARILKRLNFIVKTTLQQDTEDATSDDGMDVGVISVRFSEQVSGDKQEGDARKTQKLITDNCTLSSENCSLIFAGAKLPLLYFRNDELVVVKGDSQSIGYKQSKRSDINFEFTNHAINIEPGMRFYMYTDGYTDQLGGEKKRAFGNKRFRKLLNEIVHMPSEEQKKTLLQSFEFHRGDIERQDDVTVIGFRF